MRSSLLCTILALEIYRRKHGAYPAALKNLPKKLLPEIPRDIFHPTGAPIQYKRHSPLQAVIYSVGKNGIDDGGRIDEYVDDAPLDFGYRLDPRRLKPVVAPKP